MTKLQTTTQELDKVKLDFESETASRRELQQQTKDLSSKLTVKPYVSVIIDADGYQFLQVGEGVKGGQHAADMLSATMKTVLKRLGPEYEHCDVVVDSYANTEGLGRALVAREQIRSVEDLRLFWTGFVCRQRMFAHVDVGHGRETADQRIRGTYAC